MGKITEDMLERETLRASKGGHDVELAVLPRAGAHLASLVVDGQEMLHFSREAFLERGPHNGFVRHVPHAVPAHRLQVRL